MDSSERARNSRFWRLAALIGVLFLAVRVILLRQLLESPVFQLPVLDSEFYHIWGIRLAIGEGHPAGPFWLSPLYPVFLGGLFKAAGSYTPVLAAVAQILLSMGTLAVLLMLTRRLFGDAAALVAGALAALYAPWAYYDAVMLSASLILFINALLLLLLATRTTLGSVLGDAPAAERWQIWLGAGVLTGVSALARPSALLFAVLLVLWLALSRAAGKWVRLAALAAGVAVCLLPVLIRNYSVAGSPVLTTSSGGINFFIGNRAGASGIYDEMDFVRSFDPMREAEGYRAEAARRLGREVSLNRASRYWAAQAWDDILHDPAGWLRLMLKKLWLTAQREEIGNNLSFRGVAGFSPLLGALPLRWGLLLPLALAGWAATRRQRRLWKLLGIYAAAYVAANLLFFSASEYRFPLLLVLLPAAGCFFAELWSQLKAKRVAAVAVLCGIYVAGLVVCNWPSSFVRSAVKPSSDYYNMATVATDRGQLLDAVPLYTRALLADPEYRIARIGLADALWRLGNFDDARREYSIAGAPPPDSLSGAPLEGFLSELYLLTEEENYTGALEFLNQSFPTSEHAPTDIWASRAMVEAELGMHTQAIASLLKAHAKEPDSPEWPYKAGMVALQGADTARADSFFVQALTIYPAYAPARIALGRSALARGDTLGAIGQLNEVRQIRIPEADNWVRVQARDFARDLGEPWPK